MNSKRVSKRILPIFAVVGVLVMFAGTLWFLWDKSRPKVVGIETERPVTADIVKKVVASGTIEPRREVEIKPRIAGILRSLLVEPGQKVKKGDLIGEVQVIPDVVTLNDAELRQRATTLAVERASRELDRVVKLGSSGAATGFELDKLRADHELAVEEQKAAAMRVQLLREGAAGRQKGAATSTRVESTVDGMVLTVPIKEGSSVINANSFNPGTTIAVVADMSDMIFRGRVDESEVGKLRTGMPVEIVVGALEDTKFVGALEHIAPKSQVRDGTTEFEIEAAFRPPAEVTVRAGYSANANIVLDRRQQVLAINESLLTFDKDRRYVDVEVGPARFERREVRVGLSDGIRVEVLSGIDKGTVIKRPIRNGAPTGRI
ncbi:MAG TPA: efflux RND transporter periplasmic adaptor subunit [Polyangia bacterium]